MSDKCWQRCKVSQPPLAVLGYGGNTIYYCKHTRGTGLTCEEAQQAHCVVDLTVIPWDTLCILSIQGPMVDPFMAPGLVNGFTKGTVCWDDAPIEGKDDRLGNTGSFDYVALDVYLTIAQRFGAAV